MISAKTVAQFFAYLALAALLADTRRELHSMPQDRGESESWPTRQPVANAASAVGRRALQQQQSPCAGGVTLAEGTEDTGCSPRYF